MVARRQSPFVSESDYQRGPEAWQYRRLGVGDALALSNGISIEAAALYHVVPGLEGPA